MADELGEWLAQALQACLDEGRTLPFTMAAVGANGYLVAARYTAADEGVDCKIIAEHVEGDGGLQLPINIMLCDSAGIPVHLMVSQDKSVQRLH